MAISGTALARLSSRRYRSTAPAGSRVSLPEPGPLNPNVPVRTIVPARLVACGQVVGQGVQLEPHGVVAERMAGQARPAERVLAFLDPLLGGAAAVVELDRPTVGSGQVGDDEADARIEFALMPFHFRNHPTRSRPTFRLVAEAGEGDDRLFRRPADRPRQEMADPSFQHLVRRQANRVADALLLQPLVDGGLGEGCSALWAWLGLRRDRSRSPNWLNTNTE